MSSGQVPVEAQTGRGMEQRYGGPRNRSLFLVHYEQHDAMGQPCGQGMGRTLDISEGGLLLETEKAVPCGCDLALTLGLEEQLVGIRGRVLRCVWCDGRYRSGVEFLRPDQETHRRLAGYIIRIRALRDQAAAGGSSVTDDGRDGTTARSMHRRGGVNRG